MNREAVNKGIFSIGKYGLFLCLPLFLVLAYSFISSSPPRYRATAKIALKNVTSGSELFNIKSKYLVREALDRLHFQVAYYDSLEPDRELSGSRLPIELVFNPSDKVKQNVTLGLKVTSDDYFDLTHGDTTMSIRFNTPVNEYYGRFSVVHAAGEQYKHVSYTIKLYNPATLFDKYYNALHVKGGTNNIWTLDITTGNPEESAAFLEKLIFLYGDFNSDTMPRRGALSNGEQMDSLVFKASAIKNAIKQLSTESTFEKKRIRVPAGGRQQEIIQVIKPYVEAPISQFVQVPYTDEVNDTRLRRLLSQFNELELKKQHILADEANDSAAILQADNSLVRYRNAIMPALYTEEKVSIGTRNPYIIADSLKKLASSLALVRENIKTLKKSGVTTSGAFLPVRRNMVVLENPGDNIQSITVNSFEIYLLAVLAGLFIPFISWVIREPGVNTLPSNLFNLTKLAERIKALFEVKQID
jgi:hypothetical protein